MFLFSLYSENREIIGQVSLMDNYNRPTDVLIKYMDDLVRGLSMQNTQKVDMQFTQTVCFCKIIKITQGFCFFKSLMMNTI